VDTTDIAMLHIAEDFRMKFVPTPQDYLQHLVVQSWMNNGVKELDSPEAKELVKQLNDKLHYEQGIGV
jgi:acid phosphatase class B